MSPDRTDFTTDMTDFDQKFFRHVLRTVPDAAIQALDRVGPEVLADAIKEEPRCPHLTGNLWKSQAVEPAQIIGQNLQKIIGFAADYAAATHEAPDDRNWTLEGSGPKYLETKLARNTTRYVSRMATIIKDISGQ